jgi:hypothetical protein
MIAPHHIFHIVFFKAVKYSRISKMTAVSWASEEICKLLNMVEKNGMSPQEIALELGKSPPVVAQKYLELSLENLAMQPEITSSMKGIISSFQKSDNSLLSVTHAGTNSRK